MVYLSRIYTGTGDQGQTSLGDGTRVMKDHLRVAAYGTVDELNSVLGLITASYAAVAQVDLLRSIQNDLFDLGADLCRPQTPDEQPEAYLRVTAAQAKQLEKAIDHFNEGLKPLTSFVLPGGHPLAAWAHLARTVCRRAEREVVSLAQVTPINEQVVIYLNRLSDLLFILGRVWNGNGQQDVLWQPGMRRQENRNPSS